MHSIHQQRFNEAAICPACNCRSPVHWQSRVKALGPAKYCRQAYLHDSKVGASSGRLEPSPTVPEVAERRPDEIDKGNGIVEGTWKWRDYNIRYQRCGDHGPPVLLIHGFGGNCDHWRKNIPVLGKSCRVHAIDLLGYGYSDKPDPRNGLPNAIYNFETWGQQAADYVAERIKAPSLIICNSVGGLAGLQAAQENRELVKAVQVHNISLRMLHLTKQNRLQRLFVARLQKFLRETRIGVAFLAQLPNPRSFKQNFINELTYSLHLKAVRNVLRECYGDKEAVTEELVDFILKPGLEPGAAQVFLDFISYSGGPLPEDLIRDAPCPVSILWVKKLCEGDKDPWEKVEWGREFKKFDTVEEFVELPGIGHCPMDEAPDVVNPKMLAFIERHIPVS